MFCLSKQELVTLASSVCGDYSQLVESGAIATPGMKPRARRFESGIFALGMYPVTHTTGSAGRHFAVSSSAMCRKSF